MITQACVSHPGSAPTHPDGVRHHFSMSVTVTAVVAGIPRGLTAFTSELYTHGTSLRPGGSAWWPPLSRGGPARAQRPATAQQHHPEPAVGQLSPHTGPRSLTCERGEVSEQETTGPGRGAEPGHSPPRGRPPTHCVFGRWSQQPAPTSVFPSIKWGQQAVLHGHPVSRGRL